MMATRKLVASLPSGFRPMAQKFNKVSVSPKIPSLSSSSQSQLPLPARRVSLISRLPVELSSLQTMRPLHSVIASARLRSNLSIESQSWCLVPQGVSMPL